MMREAKNTHRILVENSLEKTPTWYTRKQTMKLKMDLREVVRMIP
jgi:hypothetical protein